MPQQIQSGGGVPYAREALPFSSLQRDLGRMNPPNAGVSNMMDGGNFSKPYTNAQDQRNAELSLQNVQQNAISAQTQKAAGFMGEMRAAGTAEDTKKARSQQFLNQNLATVLDSSASGGAAVAQLNTIANSPMAEKFRNDIAVSRAMDQEGAAPELGKMTANANQMIG
nr:hypothetical protein 33 [Paracoccaceae bacterium]